MKKIVSCFAGLLAVLLLLGGCTSSVPVSEETEATAAIPIEQTSQSTQEKTVFGAEMLTGAEIDALKEGKERLPTGDERSVLYFNGTELACLKNRRVFYATIPQPETGGWPEGQLTAPEEYRVVIDKTLIPDDPAKMIECGNSLMVYMIGETDYAVAEVMMTYLPVISIYIDDMHDLSGSLQGASFSLHDSAATNQNMRYAESRAEVKIRGGSSASLSKKSMRLDLKDENGENRDMSFFGMRKDDDWILTAMFSDESKVRDMTGWQLWREMNSYYPDVKGSCAPETKYVEVILNGKYQGLYMFMEKFDAKTMELEDGDVLFKATSWDVPDSAGLKRQSARSPSYRAFEKKWPDITEKIDGTWDVISEYIRVAYEEDGTGFAAEIENVASVENQVDYWIFNNVTMAGDNTFKNAYYAVKDGLVYTLPWDLDISFGLNWSGDPATNYLYRETNCITRTYDFQAGRRSIKYLDSAKNYLKERWTELKEAGVVTAEHIIENAEAHWNLIHASGAIAREQERWPNVSYVDDDLAYFKDIVTQRLEWLDDYIMDME